MFSVPQETLPRRLYRVHCPSYSKTSYSSHSGFQCRKRSHTIENVTLAVRQHLDWKSTTPSPFISTFSRKSHALGWAAKWLKRHQDVKSVELMEIDPAKLITPVISVASLVQNLPGDTILPTERTEDQVEDEFLCLYNVPSTAVLVVDEVDEHATVVRSKDCQVVFIDEDVEMGGMGDIPSYQEHRTAHINSCAWAFEHPAGQSLWGQLQPNEIAPLRNQYAREPFDIQTENYHPYMYMYNNQNTYNAPNTTHFSFQDAQGTRFRYKRQRNRK